jgi:hypothetical protein
MLHGIRSNESLGANVILSQKSLQIRKDCITRIFAPAHRKLHFGPLLKNRLLDAFRFKFGYLDLRAQFHCRFSEWRFWSHLKRFEIAPRRAKRPDNFIMPLAHLLSGRRDVVARQSNSMNRAKKCTKQNQIHIESELVLQFKAFVADRGFAVDGEREIPEGLAHYDRYAFTLCPLASAAPDQRQCRTSRGSGRPSD